MKKMSKILTFILVLAMVLGTVAMAAEGDSTGTPTATTTYTITAGAFTNGTITVKYSDGGKDYQLSITAGGTVTVKSGTKVTVSFNPKPGYEFVSATYKVGDTDAKSVADFGEIEITGNTAITPVFQAKRPLTVSGWMLFAAAATTGRCITRTWPITKSTPNIPAPLWIRSIPALRS